MNYVLGPFSDVIHMLLVLNRFFFLQPYFWVYSIVVLPARYQILRTRHLAQVYVDGAHAIGCVELDMHDIGAEYYSSNLHKWMFCPPGCVVWQFLLLFPLPSSLSYIHATFVNHLQ